MKHLRGVLGVLVSLVSLAGVAYWASKQDTPRFPTAAGDLALIVAAVGVYVLATAARSWRWHQILLRAKVGHRAADAYALVPVGYMGNTVLPARGGELMRVFLLASRSQARRREVLATIIGERLLDAGSLVVLFVVLTLAGTAGTPVGTGWALVAAGALTVGIGALYGYLQLRRRNKLTGFADRVHPFVRAARPLVGPTGFALGALTLGVWCVEGVIFWLVGQSLNLDISLVEAAYINVLTAFFSLVPAAPGYVGTYEAAVVFGLHAIDITGGAALAFALLSRFVIFVPITLVGLILLVTRYGGLRSIWRRAEAAEAEDEEALSAAEPAPSPRRPQERELDASRA